ncbi:hypothetical protein LJ753_16345 [Arthrobacter sp. zg-Y20]|uniref:hypothetical protein n=1 Tax=unclassified Arthrobacter TaxID=235627 RepID=UPI001D158905|nr:MULTISPECIES: hypothetical protein [unclassified Arthrobacter]MCC3277437.1 hypothetical protein [Arthrobacter sp. zg-Y20]MDK1317597.1 hypothetical protein [Arthrobacter sp. zg.Y20]WIB05124.1 hypothetical protein QNO06_11305 [Arthrobacter sp. zg-Y20]
MGFDSYAGWALWGTAGYTLTAALVGLLIFGPVGVPGLRNRVLAYAVPVLLVCAVLPFTSGALAAVASAFLPAWALVTALYGVRGGLARGAGTAFTVMLGGIAGVGAAVGLLFLIVSLMFDGYESIPLVICFLPLLQPVVPFPRGGWQEIRKRGMELGLAVLVVLVGSGWLLPLFGESSSTDAVLSSMMGGLAYMVGAFTAGAAVKRAGWAWEKTVEYPAYPRPGDTARAAE